MDQRNLDECFLSLAEEAKELYLDSSVPVLEEAPSSLAFYRDWVGPNKPVLIRHAIDEWPALVKWNENYFRTKVGCKEVTVAVTPNGYADAVCGNKFVMPDERLMTFNDFLDLLKKPRGDPARDGIFYVQKQNSNFTDEFRDLMTDAAADMPWATEALGKDPDAVNFWIGDERAVTSMHKDHYENLYCVVSGQKTFTLLPPTDQPFVPYEEYQPAQYKQCESGEFHIVDVSDAEKVPWIPVDPLEPDLTRYPKYSRTHPVTVTVRAGEVLYLPSLWFHHVQQSHGCVAVNYWYDMAYDLRYAYFAFVENLLTKKS